LEKDYLLKHKEIPVLLFKMDDEAYELSEVKEIFDEKRLSFGLKDKENKIQCSIRLNNWIKCLKKQLQGYVNPKYALQ